jgi:hypothetical protein
MNSLAMRSPIQMVQYHTTHCSYLHRKDSVGCALIIEGMHMKINPKEMRIDARTIPRPKAVSAMETKA